MPSKELIIAEIQKLAEKSGRVPGERAFQNETGIKKSEWHGVIWRSWSDAVVDSGLRPNTLNEAFSREQLLANYANLIRELGRVPAEVDLRMHARNNEEFPSHTVFSRRFGEKKDLLLEVAKFIQDSVEYVDIAELLPPLEPNTEKDAALNKLPEGYVYLLKSGAHYKVGRSDDLERRVKQIAVNLPEAVSLEHAIRTDDPPGIEAYWHKRFANRRANGEWFKLTIADIRAFKRRKFQ